MIKLSKIQIPSLPTAKPRRLYVYLPRGYAGSGRRYPVLYMFDGHNVFYDGHATYGKSWGMKEYLEKSGRELILVAVECNHEGFRRLSEYTPWSFSGRGLGTVEAQGTLTMDWITKELKPRIDAEYRTLPEREHTLIAGSSMGGLMALYAAVEYNDVFSRAAALSPCLGVAPRRMAELIKARHCDELEKSEKHYLYIDHRHRGLGSNSCGPQPEKAYELPTGDYQWSFRLEPDA